MSVIIKTMTNLPEYCYECPCHNMENGYCQADKETYRYSIDRPSWCPLAKESTNEESGDKEKYYEDIAKAFQLGMAFGFGEKHDEMDKVIDEIKKVVNPQQKTGYWITCKALQEVKCSECRMCFKYATKFCPDCGAKMVEPPVESEE